MENRGGKAEAWSGLRRLGEVFERLGRRLRRFADERGRVLHDLPAAPRPEGDVPAPVRFLPTYDNALLAHADRRRIVSEEHRKATLGDDRVGGAAPILVDGFMRALWSLTRPGGAAVLTITALDRMLPGEIGALSREGEKLLRFLAPDASSRDVRILGAPHRVRSRRR